MDVSYLVIRFRNRRYDIFYPECVCVTGKGYRVQGTGCMEFVHQQKKAQVRRLRQIRAVFNPAS